MREHNTLNNAPCVLVVDDDSEIRELLAQFLSKHGYSVVVAANGHEMFKQLDKHRIDLVVLDLMMPGDDGLSLCRKLHTSSNIPVIMLTALGDETDRIIGLEVGADDYLAKPFNPRELLARIKAVMRRTSLQTDKTTERNTTIEFNGWRIDTAKREILNPNKTLISLTAGEYDLLVIFATHSNKVLSRDFLMDATRGRDAQPFDRSIDVQISRLRQKIETDSKNPRIIKTVRSGGYIFSAQVKRI